MNDKIKLYMILYNTDEEDLPELFYALKNANYEDESINHLLLNRNNLIHEISGVQYELSKRLLLLEYLHFYAFYKKRDLGKDKRLSFARQMFLVEDEFAEFMNTNLQKVDYESLIEDTSLIMSIVEPSEKLSHFFEMLLLKLKHNHNYIKKYSFNGISPSEFEHQSDKKALEALNNTAGLAALLKQFNKLSIEKIIKVMYTGSNIKVSNKNCPSLYEAFVQACAILDIERIPDLYLQVGYINAHTAGVDSPIIVLDMGCVNLLSYDELLFVIGHELGHIKSQHILYHQIGDFLPLIGNYIGNVTLGLGNLVAEGVQIALLNWHRKSEYTADRAGLLCCQNIDAAISAMMKIAGMPPKYYNMIDPQDFIKQAEEFENIDNETSGKLAKLFSVMYQDHPWTVMRCAELQKWIHDGSYESIINKYSKVVDNLKNNHIG